MLGVDVGGTFTDVVAVRDGRIEVTKVPSDASDARDRGRRGRPAARGAGQRGVQPREHDGPQRGHHAPAAEGRVPDHRGLPRHPRPRHDLAPARRRRPTPRWRRSFGDAARPLVPRYLRRGVVERMLADGSELRRARRGPGAPRSSRCCGAATSRASRSACSTPTSTRPTRSGCASSTREVLGDDVAVSISSETSPLAKEYARASTTVIDVFMKLIFGRYSTRPRRRPARARLRRAT